ncbi:hypothetical protein BH11ACT8_BH11ACT8_06410 [soil metagenome]
MNDDELLREAIAEAVSDVEPTNRLAAIRRETSQHSNRRWYAVGGASVLAAAASVTAVAVLGNGTTPRADDPAGPSPSPVPTAPAPTKTAGTAPDPSGSPVAVYYIGAGPDGADSPWAVLFREFVTPTETADPVQLLMTRPEDPDYLTEWEPGSLLGSSVEDGVITVTIGASVSLDRPRGWSGREAELAVQQVVYTLQAHYGDRLPVQFASADGPRPISVLGVPTNEPLAEAPALDTLSHMSISDPAEGSTYSGSFTARGVSNGFEASVACWLYVGNDGGAYGPWITTAAGWQEPRLFPWELEVDLSDVPAGDYSFECSTDDPSGGAEGSGAGVDTRDITVE